MKILIIDSNTTKQAEYAERLNDLPSRDVETLDLHIMLMDPNSYEQHLDIMDLVVLGSGLGEGAIKLTQQIKQKSPDKNIIVFVDEKNYTGEIIKQAHYAGVRRVMFDLSNDLEFLQELYSIDAEFRRAGKLTYGQVTVCLSPKGGAGTTSFVAALGDIASANDQKTLLWDFDFSTQDLSRALGMYGKSSESYLQWMDDLESLNIKTFLNETTALDDHVDLLSPPTERNTVYDLVYHNEGNQVLGKILDLARYNYSRIIIDIGDPASPASEAILNQADQIVILTGECALSITACDLYIEKLSEILPNLDKVKILNVGAKYSTKYLQESLKTNLEYTAWLSSLPEDDNAWSWPGSGSTLYSLSRRETQAALTQIAAELDIIDAKDILQVESQSSLIKGLPFFKKLKALPNNSQQEEQQEQMVANA